MLQTVGEDETPLLYSFYTEVSGNKQVVKMILTMNTNMQATFTAINVFLQRWRRYRRLWKQNKASYLEKFAQRHRQCEDFDFQLQVCMLLSLPCARTHTRVPCRVVCSSINGWRRTWRRHPSRPILHGFASRRIRWRPRSIRSARRGLRPLANC